MGGWRRFDSGQKCREIIVIDGGGSVHDDGTFSASDLCFAAIRPRLFSNWEHLTKSR